MLTFGSSSLSSIVPVAVSPPVASSALPGALNVRERLAVLFVHPSSVVATLIVCAVTPEVNSV